MSEAAAAEESSLVALNMDLPDIKMDDEAKEKMSVMDALHSDDLGDVEMDGASEQYLTQKLLETQTLSKENTVDKAKLVEALLEADAFGKEIVSAETLEVISGAVSKAKVNVLARRYLVRLLSAMAVNSKDDWAMAKDKKEALVSAVTEVQSE